jgi:hypothetical protein
MHRGLTAAVLARVRGERLEQAPIERRIRTQPVEQPRLRRQQRG